MSSQPRRKSGGHESEGSIPPLAVVEALAEQVPGAVLVFDDAGALLFANGAGHELFGRDPRSVRRAVEVPDGRFSVTRIEGAVLAIEKSAAVPRDRERIQEWAERHGLSRRQREVLAALAAGQSNPEIAAALGIALSTVETHVSQVLRRSGCETRTELVAMLFR